MGHAFHESDLIDSFCAGVCSERAVNLLHGNSKRSRLFGRHLCVIQKMPPLLPDRDDFPLTRLFTSPQAGYAIAAFAILIAPFMEELVFRGVLFSFFQQLI